MTTALRAYARANQAAVIVPFILGGAMGPVTNAGAIAQSLAETMAGCALTQLERPGAPVIFGNFLSSMSLRSGSPTFGTPEPAIGSMVIGQLARRLNLPLRCSGNFTTSKLPDAQAMNEGDDVDAGGRALRRQFHPAFGRLPRWAAVDVLREIRHGRRFLRRAAHLSRRREDRRQPAGARRLPARSGPAAISSAAPTRWRTTRRPSGIREIADNEPFEKWEAAGSEDAAIRANRRWKKALAEYEAPPLDVAIDEALQDFMDAEEGGDGGCVVLRLPLDRFRRSS